MIHETIEPKPILIEPILLTKLSEALVGKSAVSVIADLKNYIAADWTLNVQKHETIINRILTKSIKYN
jgi:hypothetical protein